MINFKDEIADKIKKAISIEDDIKNLIENPPNKDMGDYAFPCFSLAKSLRKSPMIIANEIKDNIDLSGDLIEKVDVQGGYLNFFVNKKILINEVLKELDEKKENFGSSNIGNGKNIIVEYSSPNIAKPFHIGHLRTTVIGSALYNIYKFLGYNVTGINHLGDYGTQFGKMIEGYKRWGNEYDLNDNPIDKLMDIYVRINNLCKEDENVLEICRDNFKKLEEGDEYCTKIWNKFKDLSLKEFQRIYDLFGVKFDSLTGEAFYADKVDDVCKILEDKGIVQESEGAKIIDLEDKGLGVCMIRKANGSSIYATRDLATIRYRAKTYDFDKCLYVVAYEQNQYFKQIFEIAKYLDIPEKCVKGLKHISYGMTRLSTGKMSTREGTVVKVDELLNEAIDRVNKIIKEKNPDMENREEEAKKIGIGAVIFNNLCTTLVKDQIFDWDIMLNFNGETGPYIQYIYVRTKSVIEKAGRNVPEFSEIDINNLTDKASLNIIELLYNFSDVLVSVSEKNETCILTRYLLDLAKAYSNFYNENKIITDDEGITKARLYLSYVTGIVLKTGSKLLGIEMPDKM